MTSTTSKLQNGVVVFICGGRKRHPERCTYCTRPRVATCDFKGCTAALCGQCKRTTARKDHCRLHEIRGDEEGGE